MKIFHLQVIKSQKPNWNQTPAPGPFNCINYPQHPMSKAHSLSSSFDIFFYFAFCILFHPKNVYCYELVNLGIKQNTNGVGIVDIK